MSQIHVHIDRVVFRGMDTLQRTAFLQSLKDRLAHTLANPHERSAWKHSRRTPVLRMASELSDTSPASARRLGDRVARSIGKGLKA
jgi:hypothetical protein